MHRRWANRRAFLGRASLALMGCPAALSAAPKTSAEDASGAGDLLTRRAREAIGKGLEYLASRQNADGSFGGGGYSRNVAICGLCGMAFLANGHAPGRGKHGAHVQQCLEMVLRNVQESGFINAPEAAGRGPMYGHGFATLFLAEVYGMSRDARVRETLAKAVRLIVNTQNAEGGWRYEPRPHDADISVTVCQVMALRAARNAGLYVPHETIRRSVEYVKRCQNPDGGFMYQASGPRESLFPRSAAALVALYSAGIYEGEEIRKGLEYLMRHSPAANAEGEQSYYYYGHYYAVQAAWHAGGKYWQSWYPAIRDILLGLQREDGSWYDSISPEYGTAMAVLILHMPSNYLPIFQR